MGKAPSYDGAVAWVCVFFLSVEAELSASLPKEREAGGRTG